HRSEAHQAQAPAGRPEAQALRALDARPPRRPPETLLSHARRPHRRSPLCQRAVRQPSPRNLCSDGGDWILKPCPSLLISELSILPPPQRRKAVRLAQAAPPPLSAS